MKTVRLLLNVNKSSLFSGLSCYSVTIFTKKVSFIFLKCVYKHSFVLQNSKIQSLHSNNKNTNYLILDLLNKCKSAPFTGSKWALARKLKINLKTVKVVPQKSTDFYKQGKLLLEIKNNSY